MPSDIQLQPFLALQRLIVTRGGNRVYEQQFHDGVNIIYGENGAGKSTIMDFIFHALGGEVGDWKGYAALCDNVIAEIIVNDAVVTLRREVSSERQRSLQVFFGPYETALARAADGWQTFPYKRSESRLAFSQILFRALGLPEAQTSEGDTITMHQLLRLLYADQMTPVQRIFRFETFDPPIIKQAIGDFLCGIGGFELYERQTELRELVRSFSSVNAEIRSMIAVTAGTEMPLNRARMSKEIDDFEQERTGLYEQLARVRRGEFGDPGESKRHEKERRDTFERLSRIRTDIQLLERECKTLEFEIQDSELFISHIDQMLAAIELSALTYEELGGVRFEFCPACFTAVAADVTSDHCHLCKEPLPETEKASRTLAVKLDLQIQRRESLQLQNERNETLGTYQKRLRRLRRDNPTKSAAYDALLLGPMSSRDAKIGELSQRVGFIDRSIQTLNERIELVNRFEELSNEKARLNGRISKLNDDIAAIIAAQDRRKREAYTKIADHTLEFLHGDIGVQDDFVQARAVQFSFGDDAVFVDEKSNFAASSLVILKNSHHLAMLSASIGDAKFFLPRFMMFDNIEDKGMVPERSWNFQRIICEMSAAATARHQIIFTTSMLNPILENSKYIIGGRYSKSERTLKIR